MLYLAALLTDPLSFFPTHNTAQVWAQQEEQGAEAGAEGSVEEGEASEGRLPERFRSTLSHFGSGN